MTNSREGFGVNRDRPGDSEKLEPAHAVIRPHLDPSERLIWADRPSGKLSFEGLTGFSMVFAFFFIGFGLFWISMAISAGAPTFFVLFGAFVPVAGAYQMFGPFWRDARERRKSVYAITDKRSLIVSGKRGQSVRWQDHKTMPEINVAHNRDGTGSITFGPAPSIPWNMRFSGFGVTDDRFAFKHIPDVQDVVTKLRNQI